jgi:hypothetical protein
MLHSLAETGLRETVAGIAAVRSPSRARNQGENREVGLMAVAGAGKSNAWALLILLIARLRDIVLILVGAVVRAVVLIAHGAREFWLFDQ